MDKKKKEVKNPEIENLKQEVEQFKNKYLRALADYQNLEKKVAEERINIGRNAQVNLVMKLMPFLDNLDKAEIFVKDPGLKLAKDHLEKIFEEEVGLEELNVLNKEYDPYTSEVIDVVQGDKDNVVTEVLRKGYKLGDKILRVAQVKVSKKIS